MQTFLHAYRSLLEHGQESRPRGRRILEIENFSTALQPYERLTSFAARNLNLPYCVEEFLWYLRGDRYDTSIEKHATMWAKIRDPRDGGFNSNYGQYLFASTLADGRSQFQWCVDQLTADPDSRRAAMSLLNASHLFDGNPDIVCTYGISFRIRDGALNMSVSMRSNDAIFGLTNDAFCFSMIHEMMLVHLRRAYPDLQLGTYTHKADSFHVYERHFDMLDRLVREGESGFIPVEIPKATDPVEYKLLRADDYQYDPKEYPFTAWVHAHRAEPARV